MRERAMGSLMAGWDSPVHKDPKRGQKPSPPPSIRVLSIHGIRLIFLHAVAYQRNKSFTKEEIEAYWKSKKKAEDEDHRPTKVYRRSTSMPTSTSKAAAAYKGDPLVEIDWEKLVKNKGWWTRSNWAFLNEPPVLFEEATNRYTSHFQVTNLRHFEFKGGGNAAWSP
ncbi:hypothetical protein SAY86_019237 [Trapa natans]|uniref:Uncharacterized protein n=1 Tax=Trapa natans TaxID=22666 RepID=A0AAN7LHQ6_TRANT|nr:hypothetical protein SAY86_019237 [Trapa natans]